MEDFQRTAELIVARLSGAITPEQERELNEWLAADPRHMALWRHIADGGRFLRSMEEHCGVDWCMHFGRFERWVRRENQHETRRERRSDAKTRTHMRWWMAAAAVMIVAGAVLMRMDPGGSPMVQTISPGHAHGRLTLPDGREVELGGEPQTQLQVDAGVVVRGDTLDYTASRHTGSSALHTITIPRGGEFFLYLSDGSRVWLNSETKLRYLPFFGTDERVVELDGEAYFDVASDPARPFVVRSGGHSITALGTAFGVRAYHVEHEILTTLESGVVEVRSGERVVKLAPGMQAVAVAGHVEVREVDTSLYTAWRGGKFIFRDQPLREMLGTLARWYDMEVVFTDNRVGEMRFTGELRKYDNIDSLLQKIETLEKVRFSIADRTVTVMPY